jgi:autotransporter passenger strand-loop-strand repeat protein
VSGTNFNIPVAALASATQASDSGNHNAVGQLFATHNYVESGGASSNDVLFAVGMNGDTTEIRDFNTSDGEKIIIFGGNVGSFDQLQSGATQSGANTVINLGNGATLILDNVTATNLTSGDFIFQNGGGNNNSGGGGQNFTYVISGGQTSGGLTVGSGQSLEVLPGGTASGTQIVSGGQADISGLAISSFVGGAVPFSGGGTQFSQQTVFAGGLASGTVLASGGQETVLSGGTEIGATVSSGGGIQLGFGPFGNESGSAGGVDSGTTLSGGFETVFSGGVTSNVLVLSGGNETVVAGGTAVSATVSSGGSIQLGYGAFGNQSGSAGGTDISGVLSGGFEGVNSGGVASNVLVLSGGFQNVFSGGIASNTTVLTGGSIQLGGFNNGPTAGGTTVNAVLAGGSETVSSGGIASNTSIGTGGFEVVSSGGTLNGAALAGGTLEIAAGVSAASGTTISFATVNSGSVLRIDGTTMPGATIAGFANSPFNTIDLTGVRFDSSGTVTELSGGVLQIVESGQTYDLNFASFLQGAVFRLSSDGNSGTDLTPSANNIFVNSGQTSSGVFVGSGVSLYVESGGTAVGTFVASGGVEYVLSGGTDISGTVSAGGTNPAANVLVYSGSLISAPTVGAGGVLGVLGGARVSGSPVIASGGFLAIDSGFTLTNYTVSNGVSLEVGGLVNVNTSSGLVTVSGGAAVGTIISSGGQMHVGSAGTASGTIVSSGGLDLVFAQGTDVGAIVSGGGFEAVFAGGTATGAVISNGGSDTVSAGGVAINTTVDSGGLEVVQSTGTMAGATLSGGGELKLKPGALVAGGVVFAGSSGSVNVLQIGGTSIPAGLVLSGFTSGDVVDLTSIAFDSGGSAILSGTTLSVTESGQTYTLQFDGSVAGDTFALTSDGVSGTEVILGAPTSGGGTGTITISGGQTSSGLVVGSGQVVDVLSGGTASNTIVLAGGTLKVESGGTADPTIISAGGSEIISGGGSDLGALISGGTQLDYGYASGATAFFGGSQVVETGATASGTIVSRGGTEILTSGAGAPGLVLNSGAALEVFGATVNGVSNGITLIVGLRRNRPRRHRRQRRRSGNPLRRHCLGKRGQRRHSRYWRGCHGERRYCPLRVRRHSPDRRHQFPDQRHQRVWDRRRNRSHRARQQQHLGRELFVRCAADQRLVDLQPQFQFAELPRELQRLLGRPRRHLRVPAEHGRDQRAHAERIRFQQFLRRLVRQQCHAADQYRDCKLLLSGKPGQGNHDRVLRDRPDLRCAGQTYRRTDHVDRRAQSGRDDDARHRDRA